MSFTKWGLICTAQCLINIILFVSSCKKHYYIIIVINIKFTNLHVHVCWLL
uniref:Uncharacterized protein n=1 Tax=Physcomitrium patens TaxID=3218 RepID=A0A2K1KBX5_PHYPA|nr:hypothetical protein PHYPA_010459 [Physcomitrium patens]